MTSQYSIETPDYMYRRAGFETCHLCVFGRKICFSERMTKNVTKNQRLPNVCERKKFA